MTTSEFVASFKEAFGDNVQLPVAFSFSDTPLTEPKEGLRCLVGVFPKVRKGSPVTLADKFLTCGGGMVYMGTSPLTDRIPNFVSNIEKYQKTPDMVREYVENLHITPAAKPYFNLQRIDTLDCWDGIEGLIFFATPDVLSGLCAWTFYDDNSESAVITRFASGCASLITMAVTENRKENGHSCFLGGFDPSARAMMQANEMTFVIPSCRLHTMLDNLRQCCLFGTEGWGRIRKRIAGD